MEAQCLSGARVFANVPRRWLDLNRVAGRHLRPDFVLPEGGLNVLMGTIHADLWGARRGSLQG
jgi:hypothetical protein